MKSLSAKLGVILIGLTIFGYAEGWGADAIEKATIRGRATLRGLKGVYVVVGKLGPDVEKDGLTEDQLLTDVELQLRKSGIRVITKQESLKMAGSPYLYVNVNTSKNEINYYSIGVGVELIQETQLQRNPLIISNSITWHTSAVGGCGKSSIKSYVRGGLKASIDVFINDYLAVNPK